MEKKKTKNSLKLLYLMVIVCIATLFSAIILFGGASTNTLADVYLYESKATGYVPEGQEVVNTLFNSDHNVTGRTVADAVDVSSLEQYCIRDDYILYTQDQGSNGFCWAFSSCNVLGTTAMIATGEYYDFSEAWAGIALAKVSSSYVYGAGGNMWFFNNAVQQYGVVLEADLPYQNSYLISSESVDSAYDYYSQYANTSFMDNYNLVTFYYRTDSSTPSTSKYYKPTVINQMKSHIYNTGAICFGMEWGSTTKSTNGKYSYKIPDSNGDGGHAITAIGWDDNIEITANSKTYKGAWICLNSWGNSSGQDGLLYVCYDDTDFHTSSIRVDGVYYNACYFYAYDYISNTEDYEEPTDLYCQSEVKDGTGYSYTTNLKGKYYLSTQYTPSSNLTKQNNMYFDDDIDITYKYTMTEGANIDSVEIYRGDTEVTNLFNISIDRTTNEIRLRANDVSIGTYKILVDYSLGDASAQNMDVIYVMNGTEIEKLTYNYSYSDNTITNNGRYILHNSVNCADLSVTIATNKTSSTKEYFYYYGSTYSTITPASSSIYLTYDGLVNDGDVVTKTISLTGSNGNSINININFMLVTEEENVHTNFFYQLNGGQSNGNLKRVLTSTTSGAILHAPTRDGYIFGGWYYDSALTQPLSQSDSGFVFDYSNIIQMGSSPTLYADGYYSSYLKESKVAYVYAKWTTDTPQFAHLSISSESQNAGTEFSISAVVDHAQFNKMKLISISWYRRALGSGDYVSVAQDEASLVLKQTIQDQGAYEYYAQMTIKLYEQTYTLTTDQDQSTSQTDALCVYVLMPFTTQITYSNGAYAFTAFEGAIKYVAQVYSAKQAGDVTIGNKILFENSSNLQFNLKEAISSAGATVSDGEYYAKVYAVLLVGDKEFTTKPVESEHVNFYRVKFVTDASTTLDDLVIDEFTIYNNPDGLTLVKNGYTFEYWCSDAETLNKYDAGETIANNLIVYAKWKLNPIQGLNSVSGVNKAYDGVQSTITLLPSHESGLTEVYTYEWYYVSNSDDQAVVLANTSNQIAPVNANDSGVYYCNVTLTDARGRSVTTKTNDISVNIERFQTVLDTQNVITEYTYTGSEQTINSGAVALDSNNNPIGLAISYQIMGLNGNKFIDVPVNSDHIYIVTISTSGNENFMPAQTQVQVEVKKATPNIVIEKPFQFFSYTGSAIIPEFVVDNDEQKDRAYTNVEAINVGEYDVVVTVLETRNYLSATDNVHITINPANIFIRANDVSGVLFEGEKELSYSIISGEVYGNDDLGIVISSNVNTKKIGDYKITLSSSNANYKVAVFEGRYYVSGWPYYLGFMFIAFMSYLIALALSKRKYQYEFETNGGSIVAPIDTKKRKEIRLDTPIKDGYKFAGWYNDMELTKQFKGKFRKSKGKTLYAKWEKDEAIVPLSEELQSAQQIVEELGFSVKRTQKSKTLENKKPTEKQVEKKPKEKTEQEKLDDIINSITSSSNTTSKQDLDDLIKNITQ